MFAEAAKVSSPRSRESLQCRADVWTQQRLRLLLLLGLQWTLSDGSRHRNWESLRTKHPWEQGWGKPMVRCGLAQPNSNTFYDARSTLDGPYKITINLLSYHSWWSLCLPASHSMLMLPFSVQLGEKASWVCRVTSMCCVMEHRTEHRTQRCKLTGCSTAPALSFRAVSATLKLVTLRSNLLCTRSAFLQSPDCHIDVAFQFRGQSWMPFPEE